MRLLIALSMLALISAQEVQIVPSEGVQDGVPSVQSELTGQTEPFKATHRWQTIKEGQHVPAGLHYRMNLETGTREAKLIERPDSDSQPIDIKAVKNALRDLGDKKAPELEERDRAKARKAKAAEIRSQQRPTGALKSEVGGLDLMSDGEIVRALLAKYASQETDHDQRLSALADLEYYVHQIDNAVVLVEAGGLEVLRKALNHSESAHRQAAAFVIGSAAQSNPAVQAAAAESGLLHSLCQAYPGEAEAGVRKKLLFALSGILRNFPAAQKKFLQLGGPDVFRLVGKTTAAVDGRERVRILTLLTDLVQERRIAEEMGQGAAVLSKEEQAQLRQYEKVRVQARLASSGWCGEVGPLLGLPDWDSQEKVLVAMDILAPVCRAEFADALPALQQLRSSYETQLAADEENDYLEGLLKSVSSMLTTISVPSTEEL